MSSAKRDVQVYKKGRLVETVTDRPIRLMPSKVAGVVYAGEVYPVYAGDRIDLDDTPTKKGLCPGFVTEGKPLPYAGGAAPQPKASSPRKPRLTIDRWNVESNRFGNYVVFDATPSMAQRFIQALEDVGLGLRRWDESVRPSADGYFYDYFARLEFDGTREQTMARVRAILEDAPAVRAKSVHQSATAMSIDQTQLDALVEKAVEDAFGPMLREARARADNLQKQLENALAEAERGGLAQARAAQLELELAALRKEAKASDKRLSQTVERLRTEANELRVANADLTARLDDLQSRAESAQTIDEGIRSANEAKQEAVEQWLAATTDAEFWEAEARKLKSALGQVTTELESEQASKAYVQQRLDEALRDLAERRDEIHERRKLQQASAGPQQGSLEVFFGRLLPRLDLDPESIEEQLEWPNPWPALSVLQQIDKGEGPAKQKSLQGKSHWREVPNVATGHAGRAARGRIYWAHISNNRVMVYLHWKEDDKEQTRFIRKLPEVI